MRSQLSLVWGVETFLLPSVQHTDEMVRQVDSSMLELGRMQVGDLVTIVAGSPPLDERLDQRTAGVAARRPAADPADLAWLRKDVDVAGAFTRITE